MRFVLGLLLAALFMGEAAAADLKVTVRNGQGAPVKDAVVTLSGPASASVGLPRSNLAIAQKDLQFQPYVLVVPRGASVSFPNLDRTRHHVYSFSPAGPFELKLYAGGETRSVKFDKTGTIAIGCNIHDQMSAYLRVTDAPWAGVTDAAGVATLHGVEPGARVVEVWHPLAKGENEGVVTRPVQITGAPEAIEIRIALRRALPMSMAY